MAVGRSRKVIKPVVVDGSVFQPVVASAMKSFWDKMGPILTTILVVASFAVGSMRTKIKYLEQGLPTSSGADQQQAAAAGQQPAQVVVKLNQIKDLFGKNVVKFGKANAKNLFVEFADPSCPYCHVASGKNPELNAQIGAQFKLVADGGTYVAPEPEMKKLVDSGKAGFVWIFTPGHGNGELATKTLYCAFDEGKFWDVHDILMTNKGYDFQNNVAKNDMANADKMIDFVKTAISSQTFKDCVKDDKYKDRLAEEIAIAKQFGVGGTPGFFVNETRFGGAYNWDNMKSALK